jgi:hypothetical protein
VRYFYALLAIITAILLMVKPELSTQILATALVTAGILTFLSTE